MWYIEGPRLVYCSFPAAAARPPCGSASGSHAVNTRPSISPSLRLLQYSPASLFVPQSATHIRAHFLHGRWVCGTAPTEPLPDTLVAATPRRRRNRVLPKLANYNCGYCPDGTCTPCMNRQQQFTRPCWSMQRLVAATGYIGSTPRRRGLNSDNY